MRALRSSSRAESTRASRRSRTTAAVSTCSRRCEPPCRSRPRLICRCGSQDGNASACFARQQIGQRERHRRGRKWQARGSPSTWRSGACRGPPSDALVALAAEDLGQPRRTRRSRLRFAFSCPRPRSHCPASAAPSIAVPARSWPERRRLPAAVPAPARHRRSRPAPRYRRRPW